MEPEKEMVDQTRLHRGSCRVADVNKQKAMPSLSEEKIGVEEEDKRATEFRGFLPDSISFLGFPKQSLPVRKLRQWELKHIKITNYTKISLNS